jgi:hypothetical protein
VAKKYFSQYIIATDHEKNCHLFGNPLGAGNSGMTVRVKQAKFANHITAEIPAMRKLLSHLLLISFISLCIISGAQAQKKLEAQNLPPELNDIIQDSSSWWMQNSWHFNVYGRPLSQVYQDFNLITDSLERHLDYVTKRLNIRDPGLIQWYGLPGPVDSTGAIAKAYPEFGIVLATYNDTLRNFASVQVTQVILGRAWGMPKSPFMSEGMAAAMEGYIGIGNHREKVEEAVRRLKRRGKLPAINNVITQFDSYPRNEAVSVAASFLNYVLDRYGVAPMKALYILAKGGDFRSTFQKIYARQLTVVEKDWVATIR